MANVHANENNTRYQLKHSSSISNGLKGLAFAFLWLLPRAACANGGSYVGAKKIFNNNRWHAAKRERAAISANTHRTPKVYCGMFTTGINVWDAKNGGKTWPTNVYLYSQTTICLFFSSENLFENLLAEWIRIVFRSHSHSLMSPVVVVVVVGVIRAFVSIIRFFPRSDSKFLTQWINVIECLMRWCEQNVDIYTWT